MEADHALTSEEVARYSRQLLVQDVGIRGQEKLKASKVLVIGAGGLGSPCLLYLVSSGIGTIGIIDNDEVDISNLHRQVLHDTTRRGINKAESARSYLSALNPLVKIQTYPFNLTPQNASEIVQEYDVLVDGTDNPLAKYLINDLGIFYKKPIIFGSALRWEGHMTVFGIKNCYRCVFPTPPPANMRGNCASIGVIGAIPGMIGVLQALETIKVVLGNYSFAGKMLIFDGQDGTFRNIRLRETRPDCLACSGQLNPSEFNYTEFIDDSCETFPFIDESHLIDAEDYKRDKENTEFYVLDVRPEAQFQLCRLPNSHSVPISDLQEQLETLRKVQTPIIVVCKRGITATRAGLTLLENQISNFKVLAGGLTAWARVDPAFPSY